MNDAKRMLNNASIVEPDADDLQAIKRIEQENDASEGITLDEMDALRAEQEYSGKISLRVPKTLLKNLVWEAKKEGISLNQFILYKLAK